MKYYLTITDTYCGGDYYGFDDPEYQGSFGRKDMVLFEGNEKDCVKHCIDLGEAFISSIKQDKIKRVHISDSKNYAYDYRDGKVYSYHIEYLKEWVDDNELIFKHKSQTHFVEINVNREDRFNEIKKIANMIDFDIEEIL